ncbi:MAG: Ribosomal RNA large subunit methyltransferase H [Firmicutes bacterium ADurb.Bin300]|jgi:23S rRNA (pseudouridine1915-N3)-methyltransferase|nr:MAG: Ribosomal RNA large subunit methyltransferase H [Firmicutes bacterium ADurb.Bin300]
MQSIHIICPGKLKESYLCDAVAEYSKRLSPYCKLTVTELPAQRLPENPSRAQIEASLKKEAESIIASIPELAFVCALCIEGKQLSSEQFAKALSAKSVSGISSFAFIIGSSHGLDASVKERADFLLSLSEMTFPHQLTRVILLEQIYRSYQIDKGGKYHK